MKKIKAKSVVLYIISVIFLSVTLQVLYKLKTAKIFEKPKKESQDDDPFAVYLIYLCPESRTLCVAGATHLILFKFSKQEVSMEICVSIIN